MNETFAAIDLEIFLGNLGRVTKLGAIQISKFIGCESHHIFIGAYIIYQVHTHWLLKFPSRINELWATYLITTYQLSFYLTT